MIKKLLKLLDQLTSLINQLPDENIRTKERKSPYQKGLNIKVKNKNKAPPRIRPQKRKGSLHSEEKIFNHPRK